MSEQESGYLNEPDLIEECFRQGLADWQDGWGSEVDCAIKGTIKVLRRRHLLNDLGIQELRKAGIKAPESQPASQVHKAHTE